MHRAGAPDRTQAVSGSRTRRAVHPAAWRLCDLGRGWAIPRSGRRRGPVRCPARERRPERRASRARPPYQRPRFRPRDGGPARRDAGGWTMTGEEARRRLRVTLDAGGVIIGAGAGTGLSAKCAEAGGADLIIIYNSG